MRQDRCNVVHTRTLFAVFLASLTTMPLSLSARPHPGSDPGARTRQFIEYHKTTGPKRDARSMAALRRQLSPGFYRAVDAAFREDRETSAMGRDLKPPHADFSFICSDGSYDGYKISSTRQVSPSSVDVIVSFYDLYHGETYRWKDRYRWIRTQAGWRLDDIDCEIDRPDGRHSKRKAIDHG